MERELNLKKLEKSTAAVIFQTGITDIGIGMIFLISAIDNLYQVTKRINETRPQEFLKQNFNWLVKQKIPLSRDFHFDWGAERIRTAVQGFADLCLATRPQHRELQVQSYLIEFKKWYSLTEIGKIKACRKYKNGNKLSCCL